MGEGKGKGALATLHYQRDLWVAEKMEEGCENTGVLDRKLHLQWRQERIY